MITQFQSTPSANASTNKNARTTATCDDPSPRLFPPRQQHRQQRWQKNNTARSSRRRLAVLRYESDWVCINKPAGITVHQNHLSRRRREAVVQSVLKRQLSRKVWPVHRLDHRTSGALLAAFDAETCARLHRALADERSMKLYVALLRGNWNDQQRRFGGGENVNTNERIVNHPLMVDGRLKNCTTRFLFLSNHVINGDGDGHVEDHSNSISFPKSCTLVAAIPVTGRTHQIRRHAFHGLGMPVLGDTQHGNSRVNRYWRDRGLHRLALHCLALKLPKYIVPHFTGEEEEDDDDDENNDMSAESAARTTTALEGRGCFEGHETVMIVAPLPEELRAFLTEQLPGLWRMAVSREPLLETPWIDVRTGTLGVVKEWQQQRQKKTHAETA